MGRTLEGLDFVGVLAGLGIAVGVDCSGSMGEFGFWSCKWYALWLVAAYSEQRTTRKGGRRRGGRRHA